MKQKLVIAFVALLFGNLFSQASAENKVDWGMKLAMDCELPGKWKGDNGSVTMYRPGYGVNIGAVANIEMAKGFYIEPGLALFYSGYKFKDLVIPDANGAVEESNPKQTKWGIQVPLVVGYEINLSDRFGLDFYTGPQMRYAFAGSIDIKNKALKEELADSFNLWNMQRRFDLSWKIGLGLPLKNNSVLSLEADLGITDLLKSDMSFRENRIGIGFTKFF